MRFTPGTESKGGQNIPTEQEQRDLDAGKRPAAPIGSGDNSIEVNGFSFRKDEIVSVTVKRNGVEQTIYAPVNSKPVGFAG